MTEQTPNWDFDIVGTGWQSWPADALTLAEWQALYKQTPSATAFLSPIFADTWFGQYSDSWAPLLVTARDSAGSLRGILPLARQGKLITGVGAHQAEYHGWLCAPKDGFYFIKHALNKLFRKFSHHFFRLPYVAPGPNAEAIVQLARDHQSIRVAQSSRPLMQLRDNQASETLRKKSNKSKINRLKRKGHLLFKELTEYEEIDAAFDDIVALYDFRQGATNDSCPFLDDPRKKPFHLDWWRGAPEQFYISCLSLDDKVIAALIGIINGNETAIAILAYSEMYRSCSPGKIIIYKSVRDLISKGQQVLDLTPGGEWKQRFATHNQRVFEVNAYASRSDAARVAASEMLLGVGRSALNRLGIAPAHVKEQAQRVRSLNMASIVTRVNRVIPRRYDYLVYKIEPDNNFARADDQRIQVDNIADLVQFKPVHAWQSRQGFLSQALARMTSGTHAYSITDGGRLLHYGWLSYGQESSFFTEVGQEYKYPETGAVLYDFFTIPEARGRGYYQRTITQMLADVSRSGLASVAYISVLADNAASRHVIEKVGFEMIARLSCTRFLGYEFRHR